MTGYQSKRAMAQEPVREALKLALVIEEFDKNDESLPLELLKPIAATLRALAQPAQPAQEPDRFCDANCTPPQENT